MNLLWAYSLWCEFLDFHDTFSRALEGCPVRRELCIRPTVEALILFSLFLLVPMAQFSSVVIIGISNFESESFWSNFLKSLSDFFCFKIYSAAFELMNCNQRRPPTQWKKKATYRVTHSIALIEWNGFCIVNIRNYLHRWLIGIFGAELQLWTVIVMIVDRNSRYIVSQTLWPILLHILCYVNLLAPSYGQLPV